MPSALRFVRNPLLQGNLNFGKAANPDRVHGCCDFGQLLPYKAPPELGQNNDRDLAFFQVLLISNILVRCQKYVEARLLGYQE